LGTPPEASTPAPPVPRRRTLTPYAWLDALLGLPAGGVLAFALFGAAMVVQSWWDSLLEPWESLALMGFVALLCAGPCLLVRRRFPLLAALMVAGAAVVIFILDALRRMFRSA